MLGAKCPTGTDVERHEQVPEWAFSMGHFNKDSQCLKREMQNE